MWSLGLDKMGEGKIQIYTSYHQIIIENEHVTHLVPD